MLQSIKKSQFSPVALAVEILTIILGVALGFMVTEWREARANEAMAEAALQQIAAEVRLNRSEVVPKIAYYRHLSAVLDSLGATGGPDRRLVPAEVPGWRGISPPLLRDAAYVAATETGALGYMGFDVVSALTATYSVQGSLQRTIDQILGAYVMGELLTIDDARRAATILQELSYSAQRVYDEVAQTVLEPYTEASRAPAD